MSRGLGKVEREILDRLSQAKEGRAILYALVSISTDAEYQRQLAAWRVKYHGRHSWHDTFPARCQYGNYEAVKRAARSLEKKGMVKSWKTTGGMKAIELSVPWYSAVRLPEIEPLPGKMSSRRIREVFRELVLKEAAARDRRSMRKRIAT